ARGIAPNMSAIAAAQRLIQPDATQAIARILASRETAQSDPATANPQTGVRASQPTSGNFAPHEAAWSQVKPDPQGKHNRLSFSDALRCHRQEWHDCNGWRQHFTTIALVRA